MKILHTADIHLDSPLKSLALRNPQLQKELAAASRDVLRKITRLAIREQAAAVLWAGDLFDGNQRNAQSLAFLMLELEELRRYNIPVYYIKGNHDAENPLLERLDPPANLHIFSPEGNSFELPQKTADGLPVWLHGVSFSGAHEPASLLPKYPAPIADAVNIGLLHSSVNGAEGHDVYAPCSVADLVAKGYDYWALGHIHKRIVYNEKPLIIMPGCPQGRDIGEDGIKSITMLDIGGNKALKAEERAVSDIVFWRVEAKPAAEDGAAELRGKIRAALEHAAAELRSAGTERAIIRLRLSGATALYWQIERDYDVWQKTAERILRDAGDFWLDKLELNISEPPARREAAADSVEDALPIDELRAYMRRAAENEIFQKNAQTDLSKIISKLPPDLRGNFGETREESLAWLEQAAAAGARDILALIAGGSRSDEQREEAE